MTGEDPPSLNRRAAVGGAAAAAASALVPATAAAQEEPLSYGDWFSDVSNFDGTVDERGKSSVTVEVGVDANGGPYGFGPAAVRIDPGTTVTFNWVSDNHNVVPEDQPEGAGWEGYTTTENTGFSYEHTFETEGLYKYFCEPHLPLGMKGAVVVGDAEIAAPEEGGGGIVLPGGQVGSAMVLFGMGGLALAVLAVFAGEFVGAIRRPVEGTEVLDTASGEATAEATETDPVHAIGHDEFDPTGTAGLIVLYFLILVGMWVFTYFVEFLGRGPTVIG